MVGHPQQCEMEEVAMVGATVAEVRAAAARVVAAMAAEARAEVKAAVATAVGATHVSCAKTRNVQGGRCLD